MPHGERGADKIRREIGDERGAGIHDHRKLLACGHEWGGSNRVGRIDPARQRIDLVLRQELLDRDFGVGAAGRLGVALDDGDGIWLYLIGIQFQIKLHAAIHLAGKFGADSGIGQNNTDLNLLRQSRAA